MLNRAELAEFLKSRRARLRPSDVGLPGGGRRRTPGLRRQEVAQLAGMHIQDTDQRLIVYCATPGSPTDAVFGSVHDGQHATASISPSGS